MKSGKNVLTGAALVGVQLYLKIYKYFKEQKLIDMGY